VKRTHTWRKSPLDEARRSLAAARNKAEQAAQTQRHYETAATHALSAVERVRSAQLASEWTLALSVDRAVITKLEAQIATIEAGEL
jgi:hypothetical protein